MLSKTVRRQDANYKFTRSSSKETSINLSNEISDYISIESCEVTLILHKEDFVAAMENICKMSNLYYRIDETPSSPEHIKDELSHQIKSMFRLGETAHFKVNHYKRADGRNYLNRLKSDDGFNLRDFLVEEYSEISFVRTQNREIDFRLTTKLPSIAYSIKSSPNHNI